MNEFMEDVIRLNDFLDSVIGTVKKLMLAALLAFAAAAALVASLWEPVSQHPLEFAAAALSILALGFLAGASVALVIARVKAKKRTARLNPEGAFSMLSSGELEIVWNLYKSKGSVYLSRSDPLARHLDGMMIIEQVSEGGYVPPDSFPYVLCSLMRQSMTMHRDAFDKVYEGTVGKKPA